MRDNQVAEQLVTAHNNARRQAALTHLKVTAATTPQTAETLARNFQRARDDKVAELLQTLAALGQAREIETGKFIL